jgi:rRNA maturation endonuclease Nob1
MQMTKLDRSPETYQKELKNRRKPITGTVARRVCLGCDRDFESKGISNRICPRCADNVRDFGQTYRVGWMKTWK